MKRLITFLTVIVLANSCITVTQADTLTYDKMDKLLGKKVKIEGVACNGKLGALLKTNNVLIWIDGEEAWPKGYYFGGDSGKKIRVTGTIIEKYDLPVFVKKDGGLAKAGTPVSEGKDLKEASHRYLLKDAEWEVILE